MKKLIILLYSTFCLISNAEHEIQPEDLEVIEYQDGKPALAIIQENHKTHLIGLGETEEQAQKNFFSYFRPDAQSLQEMKSQKTQSISMVPTIGLRLRLPDGIGLRLGVRVSDKVEVAAEAGSSVVITNIGLHGQYFPFGDQDHWSGGAYVKAGVFRSYVFAILDFARMSGQELAIGYQFNKRPERSLYSHLEIGGVRFNRQYTGSNKNTVYKTDSATLLPVIGYGIGWYIN